MPTGDNQTGKKRGPYKQRTDLYEQARILRTNGHGYRTIGTELGINWMTIRNWVSDIQVDPVRAHRLSVEARRKPIQELTKKESIKNRLIEYAVISVKSVG